MTRANMIALVERYFYGVDSEDFSVITETLTEDCIFSVETHGVRLTDPQDKSTMFSKLWQKHAAVLHKDFTYVVDVENGRIAAQFTVENRETNGDLTKKSNCNFFQIRSGKFSRIQVYMAGLNTLTVS